MEKKWYYFKKLVNGLSAETYVELNATLSDDDVKDICLDWAEDVNKDGSNRGFTYEWEDVEKPDIKWVAKEKEKAVNSIAILNKKLEMLNALE